jgi:hypothetical protein
MQRVLVDRSLAAAAAVFVLISLAGCGGNTAIDKPTQVVLSPTILSLNQGAVATLTAVAEDASGNSVAADISFTSSNSAIATVSTGGLVCGGVWDNLATPVNCTATIGQGGVGQATITATATAFNISATLTVYVHEEVDQVQTQLGSSCTTMGQPIVIAGVAFSTTAPGCSPSAPCNITSTVGPFSFGSNDSLVAASSSGIVSTYSSSTNTPTYVSGGTISGSQGQTCDLSNFSGVVGATATVTLTGSNKIAGGTQLTITAPGHGATTAPTTATLSNGTATCSGTATVSTEITSGVLTAQAPGATTVFSSVSGVNSVGTPYLTCPVQTIVVRDASSDNTTFTLNPNGTQALTADVYDTNNQYIMPTLTWGSSSIATAGVATGTSGNNPGTVTAVTGGTAYITASCSYPDCNRGVPPQYSLNVATVNVTSASSTMVYAASTNSGSLVPINTSTNTVGTAIALPYAPNSIVATPSGATVFLGSGTALMAVTVSSGAVTTYGIPGTVVAISPDGEYLLISNSSGSDLIYFDISNGSITGTAAGLTSSSAYTPDSAYNFATLINTDQVQYGYSTSGIATFALPNDNIVNALDISGQGSLAYITSASGRAIYAYSTCNESLTQTLTATAPTLVKALPNGTGAVAADSPDIDLISTMYPVNSGCPISPVTTPSSIAGYDLGAGAFTAQQLLVSYDASHAYIISNLPQILSFDVSTLTAGSAPLAGGATAYNGGITLDGTRLYVGTSDGTVHQISTSSMTDVAQIAVGLKDPNGNPVPPNLVAVVP